MTDFEIQGKAFAQKIILRASLPSFPILALVPIKV